MGTRRKQDCLDKFVIFLAKRDGIDKLVKTFQYVSKLAHWYWEGPKPGLAERAKRWEVSAGLSRKAFRTGRFLTGFNTLRRDAFPTRTFQILAILANAGEMIYFFFDHLLWLSRVGVLDTQLAKRFSFISAFGESIGYVFFVIADLIYIKRDLATERLLQKQMDEILRICKTDKISVAEHMEELENKIISIRTRRVMRALAIFANLADLIIAIADIEPNPFCNHAMTLGVSGLISAWSGWYRNWPAAAAAAA